MPALVVTDDGCDENDLDQTRMDGGAQVGDPARAERLGWFADPQALHQLPNAART